jgi:aminopeptidase-like protein
MDSLEEGEYHVVIDSTLAEGSLTYGEVRIPGTSETEFLLSTYVCHPALANDNLSGVVLLWALARTLSRQELVYTYRVVWGPGTLGPLCWLARNRTTLERVHHGLAISCVGDPGPLRYKRSRRGGAEIDRAAAVLLRERPGSLVSDWRPLGGDEPQYCSPGFDPPVGTFSRTPHGLFPEYHASADDLDLVTAPSLGESFRAALEIIDAVETNGSYLNRSPYGEPRLGKRGLYQSVPDGTYPEAPLLWVLSLSDGAHDLIAIDERSGLPYRRDPRGGRNARTTRAPRASAVTPARLPSSPEPAEGSDGHAVALAEVGFAVGLVARTDADLEETRRLVLDAERRLSAPPPTSPTPARCTTRSSRSRSKRAIGSRCW